MSVVGDLGTVRGAVVLVLECLGRPATIVEIREAYDELLAENDADSRARLNRKFTASASSALSELEVEGAIKHVGHALGPRATTLKLYALVAPEDVRPVERPLTYKQKYLAAEAARSEAEDELRLLNEKFDELVVERDYLSGELGSAQRELAELKRALEVARGGLDCLRRERDELLTAQQRAASARGGL